MSPPNMSCRICGERFHCCVSCSYDAAAELGCCSDECAQKKIGQLISEKDWTEIARKLIDENRIVVSHVKSMPDRSEIAQALLDYILS